MRFIDELEEDVEYGEYGIQFAWINKSTLGIVDPLAEQVVINFELFLVETFVHERVHMRYPELSEEEVIEKTRHILRKMTVQKIKSVSEHLLNLFRVQKYGRKSRIQKRKK